ncbi:bifunctional 3-(3-hydroxy-phenyl)propionate/3-hydroxycinnamic acid hydroxylase [Novosphingobium sp. SG720]|uniref:bifunctional 3-(3-hydroxy-phenyl)propionate/3-hydroxycinnamic acid hydroxylase MhpA n=1 Tax=Novosphingobium sp. SG720 TaxID=2586998 RepID=UPI001444D38B|nr:bifunctional 3-(3-hydroxy-phenyl)propionate/3-hydroxycinnamic acid hydroxylase [Novosphingobium sp. SG720]NKJ44798.1 3-(3-hydroxy-phenyl)propionate hydroxylase [Novosphingobium sp. SG720]
MTQIFDVAIIGYGPSGASLANLLERQGRRVLVIEQFPSSYPLPRATHIDGEAMRILQATGIGEALAPKLGIYARMRFENAQGEMLIDWPRSIAPGTHGWRDSNRFHQPDLENALQARLARSSLVTVHRGLRVTALAQDAERVAITARNDRGETTEFAARFVVGCDGANSTVRGLIGAELKVLAPSQQWLVADFIMQPGAPELPEGTVQYCDPARPFTYIEGAGLRRRWEVMLMPGDDPATFAEPERVYALLKRWITPEHTVLERAVVYTFGSAIASRWRNGRILVAGDAAHQTPPFLGQGLCSGLRDIINIAWKIDWALDGRASPDLLDSYQQELAPHVSQYIAEANRIGDIIQETDPDKARRRDALLLDQPQVLTPIRPRLGGSLWGQQHDPVAGTLAAQPRLPDGRLLDDRVGLHVAVIARAGTVAQLAPASQVRLQRARAVTVEGECDAYLDQLGTDAVIIRPDHYIFGTAATPAELDDLVAALPLAAN